MVSGVVFASLLGLFATLPRAEEGVAPLLSVADAHAVPPRGASRSATIAAPLPLAAREVETGARASLLSPALTTSATAPERTGDPRRFEPRWYGRNIFAADAAGWSVVAGASMMDPRVHRVTLGALVLGGPLVHFRQGQTPRALASLAMRVALPVVGFMAGMKRETCHAYQCMTEGSWWGAAAGSAVASFVDITMLAREDAAPREFPHGLTMVPIIRPVNGSPSFGLGGMF